MKDREILIGTESGNAIYQRAHIMANKVPKISEDNL